MPITIAPLRDNILVRLRPVAEKTGRIHRVTHFESTRRADVIAVGPECVDTRVGSSVQLSPLIGQIVGEDQILPEASVLGHWVNDELVSARGLVMVTKADTEESVGGGKIVLPQSVRDGIASYQCIVESVGLQDICDDKECERPHDSESRHLLHEGLVAGSWVLVRPRSFVPISETDPRYFVRQSDIEAVFSVA